MIKPCFYGTIVYYSVNVTERALEFCGKLAKVWWVVAN